MKSRFFWVLAVSAPLFAVGAQAQGNDHPTKSTATSATTAGAAVSSSRPDGNDSTRAGNNQPLRYESSWGSADIIRGADGPVVGTVGWFRDFDVQKLVQSSPRAVAEAQSFQTNNFRGSLVSALGAATVAIGIVVTANGSNNAASPILIISGAGAIGWGLQHINIGYRALSRALWWYNKDLTSRPVVPSSGSN
jgi:hypothetical protein